MPAKILPANEPGSLILAHNLLLRGQAVAFPTDTVYGVGALLNNSQAIQQLYRIKGRDAAKAIAVLVSDPGELVSITNGHERKSRPPGAKLLAWGADPGGCSPPQPTCQPLAAAYRWGAHARSSPGAGAVEACRPAGSHLRQHLRRAQFGYSPGSV